MTPASGGNAWSSQICEHSRSSSAAHYAFPANVWIWNKQTEIDGAFKQRAWLVRPSACVFALQMAGSRIETPNLTFVHSPLSISDTDKISLCIVTTVCRGLKPLFWITPLYANVTLSCFLAFDTRISQLFWVLFRAGRCMCVARPTR